MQLLKTDKTSEISLVDFVDSHPSSERESALLEISSAIVREVRRQVHLKGEWPTLTPDQIFVSRANGKWSVAFHDYGTYSEGELDVGKTHRMKCIRDIYRLTFFLGTGDFPLYVDSLEGKAFDRKSLPGVSRNLLALYREFFSEDPTERPGTLLDIQRVIDKRRIRQRYLGPLPIMSVAVALCVALAIYAMIERPQGESSTVVANSKSPQPAVAGEVFLGASVDAVASPPPGSMATALAEEVRSTEQEVKTVADEIAIAMPQTEYPEPLESSSLEMQSVPQIDVGNLQGDKVEADGGAETLKKLAAVPPGLDETEQLPESLTPMAAGVIEFDPSTLEKLSLEWIKNGNREEQAQALALLRKGHESGNVEATYLLAECYFYGEAIPRDVDRAIELLREATSAKSAKAASMLATIYSKGVGLDQDFAKARTLYNEAIRFGSHDAFGNLGVLMLKGQGGDSDPEGAVKQFRNGAEEGDPTATFYLAKCLEMGIGGKRDLDEASKWYVVAASAGNPKAIEWCRERNIFISTVSRNQ